ncbi:membrane-spanning 4-domains subfamily A member 4A-like [Lepisosteus oculatus]|uniref:membrane-spanning 4-domains subfamily A member 4A-like n=1 Tax=Lepisosteus oculatus TaxID=7918 RepID=UPI0037162D7D
MATSTTTSNGMTIITKVYPHGCSSVSAAVAHTAGAPSSIAHCELPTKLRRFLAGEPKALGVVEIMIGVVLFLFGIVEAVNPESIAVFSGIPFWGSIIYIVSGILSILAKKKVTPCLVKASLGMNIFSTITAGICIIMYSMDMFIWSYYGNCSYYDHCYNNYLYQTRTRGIRGVLLVFSILAFCISISISAFACKAVCHDSPQYVMEIPNPILPQPGDAEVPVLIPAMSGHALNVNGCVPGTVPQIYGNITPNAPPPQYTQ